MTRISQPTSPAQFTELLTTLKLVDMRLACHASRAVSIRAPYIFEFLGLKITQVMSESHLEGQLLSKLQEFILEFGLGFCFEAYQRRILGNHEYIGQLNTCVGWFDRNVRNDDDNPSIDIQLCTVRDNSLVEYALAAIDNLLFVSQYQLRLPDKERLQAQLEAE